MARSSRFGCLVTPWMVDQMWSSGNNVGASAAWPTANLAYYRPFVVPSDVQLAGVQFNCTGGTSAGRNFDIGIFDSAGTGGAPKNKLTSSGATLAASGINTFAASMWLTGGVEYYAALSLTSTSLTVWRRNLTVSQIELTGQLQEASANPLPSTATPVVQVAAYQPIIMLTFANLP